MFHANASSGFHYQRVSYLSPCTILRVSAPYVVYRRLGPLLSSSFSLEEYPGLEVMLSGQLSNFVIISVGFSLQNQHLFPTCIQSNVFSTKFKIQG
jgi:hypothetical protein